MVHKELHCVFNFDTVCFTLATKVYTKLAIIQNNTLYSIHDLHMCYVKELNYIRMYGVCMFNRLSLF